jgi:hypothetical protein
MAPRPRIDRGSSTFSRHDVDEEVLPPSGSPIRFESTAASI